MEAKLSTLSKYLTISIPLFLPFSIHFVSIIILVLSLITLYLADYKSIFTNFKQHKQNILLCCLFISPFLLDLIALIYTTNKIEGYSVIEKHLSLLAFPIVFILTKKHSNKYINKVLIAFVISCFTYSIMCFLNALKTNYSYNNLSYINWEFFTYHTLAYKVSALYISMYIGFCILIIIHLTIHNSGKTSILIKSFIGFILFYFILLLLLLSARTLIVSLILILFFYLLIHIRNKKYLIISSVLLIFFCSLIVLNIPQLRTRLHELRQIEFKYEAEPEGWNGVSLRLAKWVCTWDAILGNNLIIGVGPGDSQDVLQESYLKYRFWAGYYVRFDPHNQYLLTWLGLGLIGLGVLLTNIIVAATKAYREKQYLFLAFLFLFFLCCSTECMLQSQKGVVFFAFFNSFFAFHMQKNKN